MLTVLSTRFVTLSKSRVSIWMALASPPASRISRATVLMVDCGEFGSGGNGAIVVRVRRERRNSCSVGGALGGDDD